MNKRFFISTLIAGSMLAGLTRASERAEAAETNAIIEKYLQATGGQSAPAEISVEVDIAASIPKLKQDGRLHALHVISRFGRSSYRVLGFQGSNTVKNQVIARYLEAEQRNRDNSELAITPANYKFKFKGERITEAGKRVYIFGLTPRAARIGLFKGEMWLDTRSCLPVYERGRLAKNPSIFFKKVDFEQAFLIRNGRAVPQQMTSVISTRLVGKVELNVNYFNYVESSYPESEAATPSYGNLSSR